MAGSNRTVIDVTAREERGSRAIRRLRRAGLVPGVLYGRAREPISFSVPERDLRAILKEGHALMDARLGDNTVPVMVKDQQHHPVRGGFTHIDLLEVDLTKTIQAAVSVELIGVDDAPGVVQGGVLDHVLREINIEALPTAIPDSIKIDVSSLEMNGTQLLDLASIPEGLTALHDPEETVVATITPPTKVEAPTEEVEEETAVVGEAEAEESGQPEGD